MLLAKALFVAMPLYLTDSRSGERERQTQNFILKKKGHGTFGTAGT